MKDCGCALVTLISIDRHSALSMFYSLTKKKIFNKTHTNTICFEQMYNKNYILNIIFLLIKINLIEIVNTSYVLKIYFLKKQLSRETL